MAKSSFYTDGGTTASNVSSITSLNNEATASKTAAKASEDAAAASATAAANSATASASSATSSNSAVSSAQAAQSAAETALATTITHKNTATTQASSATSSAATATTKASEASTSAATAATKASEASASATNAASSNTSSGNSASSSASSATASASSASTSSAQATIATNKAADAQKLALNAEDSQFTLADGSTTGYSALHYHAKAEDEKTAAAASAATASTQATASANSATASANSATSSASSASTSSTQATNSSNSAASSATAQAASEAARDAALAALDSFDDRYLGVKSSAPTVDNDGNALATGSLYYDSVSNSMKVYSGSAWLNAYASLSGALIATNNLSDLNNAGTARTNLGLGNSNAVTFDGGVSVDNITIDGTEIDLSSGDLTVDVAGVIKLDADDNGEVRYLDGGTQYLYLKKDNNTAVIQNVIQDGDIEFRGDDNGSPITALKLDMSEDGAATFSGTVTSTGLIGNATNFDIMQNTSDGSDNKRTRIGGGGDVISSRGALVEVSGNEHGNGGMLALQAGHGGNNSQIRSYTAGQERTRLDASGNLGINATPTQKLHVGGNAIITGLTRLGDGTESSPAYQFGNDTNTGMYRSSSDVLGFSTGGTNRLTLNSSGGLITTPAAGGHAVFNEGSVDADFRVESNGATYALFVDGGNNHVNIMTSSDLGRVFNVSGDAVIQKASSGATATSGSVLVVEDDDNAELSILGGSSSVLAINFGHSGDNDDGKIDYNTTSGSEEMRFFVNASERLAISKDGDITQPGGDYIYSGGGNFNIKHTGGGNVDVSGGVVCSPNTAGKDTFELSTHASDEGRLRIKNVDTTNVQIRAGGESYFNGGFVGIGESVPLGKLHVKNGDTGSGVDAGADELIVENNTHSGITILSGQSYNGSIYFGDVGSTYDGFVTYGQGTRSMSFGTAGGTRMTLDSGGNMTITGTVDGRDVAADGSKLDGIASGATAYSANQAVNTTSSPTFANISVSGNVDGRDVSADGSKLDGIASGATNVTNTNQLTNGAGFVTTNTTYSAGSGLDLSGTTFSVESDLRGEVSFIGSSGADYIHVDSTVIDFRLDSALDMRLANNGDLHVDGNVIAYSTTTSDERLKKDIVKIDNALDKVSQLNGYTFEYKVDGKKSAGVIAQEVEKVLPSAVAETILPVKMGEDDETEYKTVQYDQLHGLLIEAIKELKAEIEELKAR